jgi:hypothetical protein
MADECHAVTQGRVEHECFDVGCSSSRHVIRRSHCTTAAWSGTASAIDSETAPK